MRYPRNAWDSWAHSHRHTTAAFVALLLVMVSGPVAAQVEYEFILVEAFNQNYDLREVYMRDINEVLTGCGTSTNGSFYDGFSWTEEGDKTIVPITWPQSINNLGQIVGDNRIYDIETGQSIIVPPAGNWPLTRLCGINDNQIAVGYAECACSNSEHVLQDAIIWDPENGSRTTGVLAARELLRVNNSNIAVGNIRPSAGSSEGLVYNIETGAHVNLSDLLPPPPYVRPWSEAHDISEDGVVTGVGWDGTFVRGLIWSPEAGFTFFPGLDGGSPDRVHCRGINTDGTVVGYALNGAWEWRAFLWDAERGMVDLNDLVDAPPGFILDWALKINDLGWIVGIGHYGPGWGTSRGYVLRPLVGADVPWTPAAALPLDARVSPNPAGSAVAFHFELPRPGPVSLGVFDVRGALVRTLRGGDLTAGPHSRLWDGRDQSGVRVAPGVYYFRMQAGGSVARRSVVVVR